MNLKQNTKTMNSPFNDKKLIYELLKLRDENIDQFYDTVYSAMAAHPDLAVNDNSDPIKKLEALRRMRKHYESKEEFEKCAFIRNLVKKIEKKNADEWRRKNNI